MKRPKFVFIVLGLLFALTIAVASAAGFAAHKKPGPHGKAGTKGHDGQTDANALMRWDIVNLDFATLTLSPGGHASAFATTSGGLTPTATITLTGHGTFRANAGNPQDVSGGGTWTTYDGSFGTVTGSGTYQVTGFVSFHLAPGFLPASFTDTIGKAADAHSGLAVFRVAYSDGVTGTLTVSCNLPGALNPNMFEGITASKGYVDYWWRDPAVAGVNANRTEFHQIH